MEDPLFPFNLVYLSQDILSSLLLCGIPTYMLISHGVKKVTVASDASFEVHLQLSNLMKGIPISSLFDDNFYELAIHLPTSWQLELETKVQVLHKDITKHSFVNTCLCADMASNPQPSGP